MRGWYHYAERILLPSASRKQQVRRNLIQASTSVMENDSNISIPLGFTLHSENNSHILLPPSNEAFLNPVQEFNRDTSVACIRVWSEELNKAKEARWRKPRKPNAKKPDKKRLKGDDITQRRCCCPSFFFFFNSLGSELEESITAESASEAPQLTKNDVHLITTFSSCRVDCSLQYRPYKFVLLEALSATGLRSIRYAKEIPLVKYVDIYFRETLIDFSIA